MTPVPLLYAIADAEFGDPVDIGIQLIAGGARIVQLRDKNSPVRTLVERARALVREAPPDRCIIVNDRADVALVAGANGVHLGQTDLPPAAARGLLGPHAAVGVSVHTPEQARIAIGQPVDYLAAGPVFPTSSKLDPDPVIGLAGLSEVCRISPIPVVAIGGIRLESAPDVLRAGAASVAVIRDLIGQGDIERRTRKYLDALGRVSPGEDGPR